MRQRAKNAFQLMAVVTLAACGGQSTGDGLGIDNVRITETSNALHITAVDADKNVVGTVELLVGPYTFVDPVDDSSIPSDGRQLTVEALGQKYNRSTNSYTDLHFSAIQSGDQTLNTFLSDSRISSVLTRWGVYFDPMSEAGSMLQTDLPQGERAYISSVACHFAQSGTCGMTSCAPGNVQLDGDCIPIGEREDVCCGAVHSAIARKCGTRANDPNCSGVGMNKCQVCSSTSYSSTCTTNATGFVLQYCTDSNTSQYRGGTETISYQ